MLAGGCFCGRVRYEARGEPYGRGLCHCSMCRRTTGAPAVAWFSVRRADFRLTSGELKRFRSSPGAERGFCGDCGAQIVFDDEAFPDEIDVTTASLDDPELAPPEKEIWAQSRIGWMDRLGHLPRYARRSDGL